MKEILNSYRFQGRLGRLPFVLSFVTLSVAVNFIAYGLRRSFVNSETAADSYLIAAFGAEVFLALAVFPLCAARLRDIGWPQILAILIFLSLIFSPWHMVIAALNSLGVISSSYFYSGLNTVGSIVLLWFILTLALQKGARRSDVGGHPE